MFLKIITLLIIIILLPTTTVYGKPIDGDSIPLEIKIPEETNNATQTEESTTTTQAEESTTTIPTEEPTTKTSTEEQIIDENTITTEQKEAETKTEYKGSDYKSLIFTEKELTKLIKILVAKKVEVEALIPTAEVLEEQKVTTTIFLNSIMYLSQDSWTIWVNEKKISNYEKDSGDLKVLEITSDKVKFLWTVSKTKWEIMMPNFNFDNSISKINENNEVETIFTLKPNQSFLPETSKIVEGKVKIEEITTEAIQTPEGTATE